MSHSLSSLPFLPERLLQRLHGTDGIRPKAEVFPAAVLYIDVSRYSSLVEQMVNRGKEGLEQIPGLLDRAFSACTEYVHERGGEVAQFAGDSLVAYWPAEEGYASALAASTECATRVCALAPTQLESRTASFHAGIGTGPLWTAAVGGANNHWSLLVGGPALRQAAAAHARARPRQFEVLASTDESTTNSSHGFPSRVALETKPTPPLEWRTGFLPARFDQLLSSALGAGVSSESSSGLAALAGFRPVTVLFARFGGLDETQPDALAAHQALCESLQSVVAAQDGPSGELLIDDKGLVFHTVFGEPGSFHKDDGLRGIRAALGIIEATKKLGWTCSVGVATGEALFRAVGPADRRVFMTLGTVMNRAARLMSVAEAGVLCDGATERACRGRFLDFAPAGQFMLGGMGQTHVGFRPSPRSPLAQVPAKELGAIIGRGVEIEWLLKVLDESDAGQRRLVFVAGEAGIGKSRLLTRFVELVRQRSRAIAVVNIERGDRQRLLVPWRGVLETLLGGPLGDDRGSLAGRLRERFAGHEFEKRLPLLGPMLSSAMEDTESTGHLVGANRADATMRFIVDVLEMLAPPGLVILMEDCQWMDSTSWRVAEWLVRRLPSLLLVMSVRQEESSKEYRMLRHRIEEARFQAPDVEGDVVARAARVLDLERLPDAGIRELVARTLGGQPVAEELGDRICAMARGNPLFAEESALALRSEGLIAVGNGRWQPIKSMERLERGRLEGFDAIDRVVRERVDHLDPVGQLVLKAATVIGRVFDAQRVQILLGDEVSPGAVDDSLADLESRHLVVVVDAPGRIFQFRHDYMRDIVYEAIPGAIRQELHRCYATWLEDVSPANRSVDLATLVQHWEAAGNMEKAVAYADAAATEALRSGSFREAEEFLRLCLSKTKPGDSFPPIQRIRWQRALAEAHYGRGNVSAQGEAVMGALALARQFQPRTRAVVLGQLGFEIGLTAAHQLLPAFFGRMQAEDQRLLQLEVFRCHSQAAIFYYFSQDKVRCVLSSFAAVNAVDRCGERPDLVRAYAQIGCALGVGGYPRFAGHFFSKAEQAAELEGNPTVLAYALLLEALFRVGHGSWDAVQRGLDRSQELSTAAGDHVTWCNAQAVRFWMYSYRGQKDDAERAAENLLARAQNSGNMQQEIWALRCKAHCALAGDRPRHAVDLLRMALTALPKTSDLSEQITSRGCLALALTRSGDHQEGVQEAAATTELFRRRGRSTVHSNLDGSSAVAEVLLRGRQEGLSKEYPEWHRWEAIALREVDQHQRAFPVAAARYGLWRGLAQWLDGQRNQAVHTWRGALRVAQRMGLRQDEALLTAEMRYREVL